MFGLVRQLASFAGASVADFCKILILIGSVFEFLRFDDPEYLSQFLSATRMSRLVGEVDAENPYKAALRSLSEAQNILVRGPRRNPRSNEGSELVKIRLPSNFVTLVDRHARLTDSARAALLTQFLEMGLMLYMRSQRAVMKALLEAMKAKTEN